MNPLRKETTMTNGYAPEIVLWLFTIMMYTFMASIPVIVFFLVLNLVLKPIRRVRQTIKSFNQ
jgi:flagellar biosynthesis protein FliR